MQGHPDVIEMLNDQLTAELTAVNVYFLAAKQCENWGYARMAKEFYGESISEMKDAEKLIDRILLLDGLPNLQRLGSVGVGENLVEQIQLARGLEEAAIERYRSGATRARELADHGSAQLMESILVGEEEHLDWVETQERLISDLGVERYLLTQVGHDD